MNIIKKKVHYTFRSLGLVMNLLTGGYIHCNIQLTHRCNFRCQICDFWKVDHQKEKELSLSEIELISEKLSRFGTLAVSLAGGEPTLRTDIDIIIGIFARHHFPIMITNGWFIDNENAERLWKSGLQEISVSLDYASKEKHDTMRNKPGAFEHAVNALKILNEKRPSARNRVHMISVLMEDNIDEIEEMIRLAGDFGVTYMVNLYSFQRGKKSERLPKKDVSEHLLMLKKKYPNFVSLSSYIKGFDRAIRNGGIDGCKAGKYFMNIDNYGNAARCTETTELPVGNILHETPEEIKKKLLEAQRLNNCGQCWTSCRGWAELMHGPDHIKSWREFYTTVKDYE